MKTLKSEQIGDVKASLYLDKIGYTYKIKARLKGDERIKTIASSFVWFSDKNTAEQRMHDELITITKQLDLFDYMKG